MNSLQRLIDFLSRLDESKFYYTLSMIRDSILVTIAVPGQRWEVEFMYDETIQIEKFITEGVISDERELEILFREF